MNSATHWLANWLTTQAEKKAKNQAEKSIVIIGAGKSGLAAHRLLHSKGIQSLILDDNLDQISVPLSEQVSDPHSKSADIESHFHSHDFQQTDRFLEDYLKPDATQIRCAILSPGIPLTHRLCQALRQSGVPLYSEVEIALSFLNQNVKLIAVTGTNGKSTVTHSLAALFNAHGKRAVAIGNIGLSVSEFVMRPESSSMEIAVVELSSYQIETMYEQRFDAAILTNFSPDHLARYKTLDHYFRAKWRLTQLCKPKAPVALSTEFLHAALQFGGTLSESTPLSLIASRLDLEQWPLLPKSQLFHTRMIYNKNQTKVKSFVELSDLLSDEASISHPSSPRLSSNQTYTYDVINQNDFVVSHLQSGATEVINNSALAGWHNAQNIAFCVFGENAILGNQPSAASWFFSQDTSDFQGLEHRLEIVTPPEFPFLVINDSKSTSFICTAQALSCYPGPLHLLIGGQLKDKNVQDIFSRTDRKHLNLKTVSCFGPEGQWLAAQVSQLCNARCKSFASMHEATAAALSEIAPGEILLLSPGAASFDSFKNFEDRGTQFKLEVARLLGF